MFKVCIHNFTSLYVEVMKKQGGFDYHIPHINKTKAAREGTLPDYLTIDK